MSKQVTFQNLLHYVISLPDTSLPEKQRFKYDRMELLVT